MLAVSVALPLVSHSTEAQSQLSPASGYRAWAGGGIGVSRSSALTAEWEAWISRGALGLSYQGSATDDFDGTTQRAHGLLAGLNIPYGRLLGKAAAGVASARRCLKEGEQAGNETCTSDRRPEFTLSADVLVNSHVAIHTSYFTIPSRSVGHSALVIGFTFGRIGA